MKRQVEMEIHACSACSGDYEDPERSAADEDVEGGDEEEGQSLEPVAAPQFPGEQE